MSVSSAEHFTCIVCDKFFKDVGELRYHMGVHTKEVCSKCSICGESLRNRYNFSEHMYIHTDEELFRCNVCCNNFEDVLILTEHMRIHTLEKHFQCVVCCRTFKKKVSSYNHMRVHIKNNEPCHCKGVDHHVASSGGMEFQQDKFLSEDDLFKCSVCNKAFSRKYSLKEHIRIHTNEKSFKCSICSEAFRLHRTLWQHMHSHSDEILYRCKVCFKTFHNKEMRENHMRTHMGNCITCKKELIEDDLQAHLEICPANKLHEFRDSQRDASKRQKTECLKESPRKLHSTHFDSSEAKRTPGSSVSEDVITVNLKSLPVDEGKNTNMNESPKKSCHAHSSSCIRERTFCSVTSKDFVPSYEECSLVVTAKDTNVSSDCLAVESEKVNVRHSNNEELRYTSKKNLKSFRFLKSQTNCSLKNGTSRMMNYVNVFAIKGEEKYKCDVCQEVYKDKQTFWRHIQEHPDQIPLRCRMCLEIFEDADLWENHVSQKCKCALCGKALGDLDIRIHSKACPVNSPFKCNICCKRFSDDNAFRDHMREHSQEESCKCKVCGEALFSKYDAQRHKELHKKAAVSTPSVSQSNGNSALPSCITKPSVCDSDRPEQPEQNSSLLKTKVEESDDYEFIKEESDYSSDFPNTIKEEISFSEDKKDYSDLNLFVSDVDPNNMIIMVDEQKDVCIDESLVDPLA